MNDAGNPAVPTAKPLNEPPTAAVAAEPKDGKDESGKLKAVINSTTNFLSLAFQEWIPALLIDPKKPPFKHKEPLDTQMDRLARLITVVCILSGIVVGGSLFITSITPWALIATAIALLIEVFVVTIVYKPVTYLFGIRMSKSNKPLSIQQLFFVVCYSFLPWTPILTALGTAFAVARGTTEIVVILIFLFCLGWICHIAASLISILTNCSLTRAWLAAATPIFGYFVLWFIYPLLF